MNDKKCRVFWGKVSVFLFTFVMMLCTIHANGMMAKAEAPSEETVKTRTITIDGDDFPSNDEMFAVFVEEMLYEGVREETQTFGQVGATRLKTKEAREFYYAIKNAAENFIDGGYDCSIRWWNMDLHWTAEELGVKKITAQNYWSLFDQKLDETVNFDQVFSCVLMDTPYQMFWYDKTKGCQVEFGLEVENNVLSLTSIGIWFPIVPEYQGKTNDPEMQPYTFNTSLYSTIKKARDNAWDIVWDQNGKSKYEKIIAYRDAVLERTSYHTAAGNGEIEDYGNPWQIIWVFDEDPTTNVVCEGYAKAFQYLCDLSDQTCYTVDGVMMDGTEGGRHMWNILPFGGKNYLVDLTNIDEGTIGYPNELFMAGTTKGSVEEGYEFENIGVTYFYSDDLADLLGMENLTLAAKSFDPSVIKTPRVFFEVTEDTILWNDEPAKIVPATVMVDGEVVEGVDVIYHYQDVNATYAMQGLPNSVGVYEVTAMINSDLYTLVRGENSLHLTIRPDVSHILYDTQWKSWYQPYVQFVYDNELMTGIAGTEIDGWGIIPVQKKFDPNGNITKAQVAQILYNMEGKPEVTDYAASEELVDVYDDWYLDAVCWAYNEGIITGDLNTKEFAPNASVTREQLALMMYRYAEYKGYDVSKRGSLEGLKNDWKVNTYAAEAVKWAVGEGLIGGIEIKNSAGVVTAKDLAPQGTATRAQMATILTRFCKSYDTGYTDVR